MKRTIKCVGYYVGPVMYKNIVANVGMYVVKGNVEPLLSGAVSEALQIISFHGDQKDGQVRRNTVEDPDAEVIISQCPNVFTGVGKLQNYQVTLYIDKNVPPVNHS